MLTWLASPQAGSKEAQTDQIEIHQAGKTLHTHELTGFAIIPLACFHLSWPVSGLTS
ncbi:hypothetical protein Q8A64_07820 [Oxalobacteraceae bacterium R-40]|uniref:Uncharacterized protein n=1 Tax=Keguizhuia sedimenti TaxID=3064264 RepID=A0ABU1BPT0_9BURK|nr:hypothetical protein [Oxalobacteraceae bacterium R-40]